MLIDRSSCRRLLLLPLLILLTTTATAAQNRINEVRMWSAPDGLRLVFDFNAPMEHSLSTLSNPDRVVIDIRDTQLRAQLPKLDDQRLLLRQIRSGTHQQGRDLRLVLELRRAAIPKSFVLPPNGRYGHRLMIDLQDPDPPLTPLRPVKELTAEATRPVVVAIDAGHGGEDPGAIGPQGTLEKNVVLAIARQLQRRLQHNYGIESVMIRDGDYYVSLRQRVAKARQAGADLLISIHADAFHNRQVGGASLYTLSQGGASSEQARLLAESENSADTIGGVSLDDKDDLLASVLIDLSQAKTIEESLDLANGLLRPLDQVAGLHRRAVEQAGFQVLKAPDIPSLLVETGFISNPDEEQRLRDPNHQAAIAKALQRGIMDYFQRHPPPGTLLVKNREHLIVRGDTLSGIAQKYRVSMESIRRYNGLRGSVLHAGKVLRIPPGDS